MSYYENAQKRRTLIPRLERCEDVTIQNPAELALGAVADAATGARKICLEIGCGKGRFITTLAAQNPDILYVALEREKGAIVMAMEKVKAQELTNVRLYHRRRS